MNNFFKKYLGVMMNTLRESVDRGLDLEKMTIKAATYGAIGCGASLLLSWQAGGFAPFPPSRHAPAFVHPVTSTIHGVVWGLFNGLDESEYKTLSRCTKIGIICSVAILHSDLIPVSNTIVAVANAVGFGVVSSLFPSPI